MAPTVVGSTRVSVIPDLTDFGPRLRAGLLPVADQLGRDLGERIGEAAGDRLSALLPDAMKDAGRLMLPAAQRAGDDAGDSFARGFKAKVTAELAKVKPTVTVDVTVARGAIQQVERRLARLGVDTTAQVLPKIAEARYKLAARKLDRLTADRNVTITADLDDATAQTKLAAVTAAVDALKTASADIKIGIDDQTTTGITGITAALTSLKALSPVDITATLDDQTAAGEASVRLAVTQLQALSPVDIQVKFDDHSAGVSSTATAVRGLRTALRNVDTRATAAAAGLDLLAAAARDLARALHDVTTRAIAARVALTDLRGVGSRLATALRRVEDRSDGAANNLTLLGDRTDRLSRQMDGLGDATRGVGDGLRGLRGNIPSLNSALRRTSGEADGGRSRLAGLAGTLGSLAVAAGGAAAVFGSAVPLLAGATAALAELAPAAGLAATGILAAVTAGVALKVGMSGVGDAVKLAFDPSKAEEFEKALKKLTPNARAFVTTLKDAGPAFSAIRKAVQERLFEGLDKTLKRAGTATLPVFRRALKDSAGALNAMAKGVGSTAVDLAESGALGKALKSATKGLHNVSNLPSTIVQGLVQVGAAAGPAFERVTKAAGGGLDRLADRMAKAFKGGGMERAIGNAVSLAKQLGQGLGNVGRIVSNVFGAAQASGGGLIGTFKTVTAELAKVTAASGVQSGLRTLFTTMATVGKTAVGLFGEAVKAVGPAITALGPHVQTLAKSLGAGLTPVIRGLAPILATVASSAGRVVSAFAPLLTVAGRLVGGVLNGLAPVLKAVGEQVALLAESAGNLLGPALKTLPDFLNPLLGMFGKLGSVFLRVQNQVLTALQPALRSVGQALGRVARAVAPLVALFTDLVDLGLRGLAAALRPVIGVVGRLAEIVAGKLAGALNQLAGWIEAHRPQIEAMFRAGERAVVRFALAVVESLPLTFGAFRVFASTALDAFGVLLSGASRALGWIPGLGGKIKAAASGFNAFRESAKSNLDKAGRKIGEFAAEAAPKLRQRLSLDTGEVGRKIPPAQKLIDGVRGVARKIQVSTNAPQVAGSAQGAIRSVKDGRPKITALNATGPGVAAARAAIASIKPRTVSVHVQFTSSGKSALGGAVRGLATGGTAVPGELAWVGERGPELINVFRGGVHVFNHQQSRRLARHLDTPIPGYATGGTIKAPKAPKVNLKPVASAVDVGFLRALSKTVGEIETAMRRVAAAVKNAFRGVKSSVDDRLVAKLNDQTKALTGLAKQRDKLREAIKAAQGFAKDTAASGQQFAALTSLPSSGLPFGAGGIASGLKVRLQQLKAFAGNVRTLAKRGLAKELIRQLVTAGPDSGAAYAAALVKATSAELKDINATQAQISKTSKSFGNDAADILYDSGKKAGQGFLAGLKAQEAAIVDRMSDLAKAIQKAVRSALKIKSPSLVMKSLGAYTVQGFAAGVEAATPRAAWAAARMAGAVRSSAALVSRSTHVERNVTNNASTRNLYYSAATREVASRESIRAALAMEDMLFRPMVSGG